MSPSKPKLADPGEMIRAGRLRTGEFRVCLAPDLVGVYEQLLERRDDELEAARDSLAGGVAVELAAQAAEVLEEMQAATLTLTFKALPRPEFRRMTDQHPARKDAEGKLTHAEDAIGVNFETFFDALIRGSLIAPVLDEETLALLIEERLTDRQWQDLTDVVWLLNRATVDVPFSSAVSGSRRSSAPK